MAESRAGAAQGGPARAGRSSESEVDKTSISCKPNGQVATVEDDKLESEKQKTLNTDHKKSDELSNMRYSSLIDQDSQESIFKCNLCADTFDSVRKVKSHITRHHNNKELLKKNKEGERRGQEGGGRY